MLRHRPENIYPNLQGVFPTKDDKDRKEKQRKKKKSNWQLARGKKRRWDKRNVRSAPPRLNRTQSLCTSEMTRTETAYFLKILFSVNNFFPRVKIFLHLIRNHRRFKSSIKNDNAPWNENVYVLRWNEISIMADDEQMIRYNVLAMHEFNSSIEKLFGKIKIRIIDKLNQFKIKII